MPTIKTFSIPEGVEFQKEEDFLVAKGPKGELKKLFKHSQTKFSIKERELEIKSHSERKKVRAVIGTWAALAKNMALGVLHGYEAEVKLIHSHFPAKVDLKDGKISVQNFLGERRARSVALPNGVEAKIDKNIIKISGLDKEIVGQASSRIENLTKVQKLDRRIFQDGCYIIKKPSVL